MENILLILWITLTRTFVLAPLRQSHESSPFTPSSSLPISDKHTQTDVLLSNVEVFISEFAVSSLNRSNLWGCDRVEREENRGVSRQVQGVQGRICSRGFLSISLGHPYSGAEETGVEETWRLHSQLARVLGASGFALGASGRERVRFVWFRL